MKNEEKATTRRKTGGAIADPGDDKHSAILEVYEQVTEYLEVVSSIMRLHITRKPRSPLQILGQVQSAKVI